MWSNHYSGNWVKDIAGKWCEKVFYTSQFSYTANKKKFPQGVQMPVGVDLESLKTQEKIERQEKSILSLARLDPSKKPELILKALKKLEEEKVDFTASFVGGTSKDKWPNYEEELFKLKKDLGLSEKVKFVGAVPSTETFRYYLSHCIYVNVSKSGMLDKTIFKALAAGCLPLTTSVDFNEMIGDNAWKVEQDSVTSLFEKLKIALMLDKTERENLVRKMQEYILNKHSLDTLINKIYELV
jgi:glycosyltransferase involved in cell wall biosynthesis